MVDSAKIPLLRRFRKAPGDLSYRGNIIVHTKKRVKPLISIIINVIIVTSSLF